MTFFTPRQLEFVGAPGLSRGLVCALPLQENDGDAYDLCGNANFVENGTVGSRATADDTSPPTNIPRARDFDGTSTNFLENIIAFNSYPFDVTADWTITMWFVFDTLATKHRTLFSQYDYGAANDRSVEIIHTHTGSSNLLSMTTDEDGVGTGDSVTHGSKTAGTWYFGAFYNDGTNIGMSTNAESYTTASAGRAYAATTTTPRIGAYSDVDDRTMDGAVAQFCVWSRILTATDLAALYNSGAGRRLVYA